MVGKEGCTPSMLLDGLTMILYTFARSSSIHTRQLDISHGLRHGHRVAKVVTSNHLVLSPTLRTSDLFTKSRCQQPTVGSQQSYLLSLLDGLYDAIAPIVQASVGAPGLYSWCCSVVCESACL